jgi:hypothetical protein
MKQTLAAILALALLAACGGGPEQPEPTVCQYGAGVIQAAGCPNNVFAEDVAECEATLAELGPCRPAGEAFMLCIDAGPIVCEGGWAVFAGDCTAEWGAVMECLDPGSTKPAP